MYVFDIIIDNYVFPWTAYSLIYPRPYKYDKNITFFVALDQLVTKILDII